MLQLQRISALAVLVCLFALPVMGQQQEGLVNVNVSDIRVDIARVLNVEENQIPVNIQAPIGIAANVCNVNANVLAQQAQGGAAECRAQNTSQAFNNLVQRQIQGSQDRR